MRINNLNRKITAMFLFGLLLINTIITIPETAKNTQLTSIDLNSAYVMPSSIRGLLHMTNLLYLAGIIYCLLNLEDRFRLFQKESNLLPR